MHLYLQFENGKIHGEGTDYVGPWTASGSIHGPFHIWPRSMGDMNELYLTEDLTVPTDKVDFSFAMAEEEDSLVSV